MKLLPSIPPLSANSSAEYRLFNSFKAIELEGVCLHSLRLSSHQYKAEGELDFVVVTKTGLFVLEVKGGAVRRDDDRTWHFTDRYGQDHRRKEGPFDQARSGMYSLRAQVAAHFGDKPLTKLNYGYGVVFTDCNFRQPTPEWDQEIIFDKYDYSSDTALLRYIKRLEAYWQAKHPHAYYPDEHEFSQLVQYLRPRFDLVQTLGAVSGEMDRNMTALTAEQYNRLDIIAENPRILCRGGAGTGKTFLAIEVAKRHMDEGKQVLFVCRSPVLAGFVRLRIPAAIAVSAFEQLVTDCRYDVLVVDEAQDLLNMANLLVLDAMVTGGLEAGCWRLFLDSNNQQNVSGLFDQEALKLLQSFRPVEVKLQRNCRNTLRIVQDIRVLTRADLGMPAAGEGPQVTYVYAESRALLPRMLANHLHQLMHQEVPPGHITLLSPLPFRNSLAAKLPISFRLLCINEHNVGGFSSAVQITFATVADFKGLENAFIVLIDFEQDQLTGRELNSLYVAMSRARTGLSFVLPKELQSCVEQPFIDEFLAIEE